MTLAQIATGEAIDMLVEAKKSFNPRRSQTYSDSEYFLKLSGYREPFKVGEQLFNLFQVGDHFILNIGRRPRKEEK